MSIADRIKANAKVVGSNIQDSETAKLEKIFDDMFYLEKKPEEESEFVRAVMTRGQDTQERIGLHTSALIAKEKDFCLRAQVLSLLYHQLQGEQLPARTKRVFEEGNAVHEKWQRLFLRAGYSKVNQLDVTQYDVGRMIQFTPDIICRIPQFHDGPMIGEIKSVNAIQYSKMQKHPSAGKQLQCYMYLTGIEKGFVLNENKNTQEFKLELYSKDESVIVDFIDRLDQVQYYYQKAIGQHVMVKRPADAVSVGCTRCSKCAHKLSCWGLPGGKRRLDSNG